MHASNQPALALQTCQDRLLHLLDAFSVPQRPRSAASGNVADLLSGRRFPLRCSDVQILCSKPLLGMHRWSPVHVVGALALLVLVVSGAPVPETDCPRSWWVFNNTRTDCVCKTLSYCGVVGECGMHTPLQPVSLQAGAHLVRRAHRKRVLRALALTRRNAGWSGDVGILMTQSCDSHPVAHAPWLVLQGSKVLLASTASTAPTARQVRT
jgi:hypothetical protein